MILVLIRVILAFSSGLFKTQLYVMKYIWFHLSLKLEFITKEKCIVERSACVSWICCFSFKNLAQTHILNELMYEMKEKGTKLKICHTSDSQLVSMR